MGKLHFVFHSLHQLRGILCVPALPFFRKGAVKGIAGIASVIENTFLFRPVLQEVRCFIIFFQDDAVLGSMLPERVRHLRLLDEKETFLCRQISIGKSHRIALHVTSADIEQPHDIVQLA